MGIATTKKLLLLQNEESGNIPQGFMKNTNRVVGFSLVFLGNGGRPIRRTEIRNINFQDVMRHLQHGDSVLITTKLMKDSEDYVKKQEQDPWYFSHV
jgi:hypothetical protein